MKVSLIGFMGSGKSLFGRMLAAHYQCHFIDLDDYIEEKEGMSVTEIFAKGGEQSFRSLETQYLKEIVTSDTDMILSLGGGTPCNDDNWPFINQTTSVYLKRTPRFLNSILFSRRANRPLIRDLKDDELLPFITKKLAQRSDFYSKAKIILHAYGSRQNIVDRIVNQVSQYEE